VSDTPGGGDAHVPVIVSAPVGGVIVHASPADLPSHAVNASGGGPRCLWSPSAFVSSVEADVSDDVTAEDSEAAVDVSVVPAHAASTTSADPPNIIDKIFMFEAPPPAPVDGLHNSDAKPSVSDC
jgi:hypothetical protein